MGRRRRFLFLVTVLGLTTVLLPLTAESAAPTMEAVNVGLYTHYWLPSEASIATGGTVTIRNATEVPHGVNWVAGPVKPSCEEGAGKVPVGTTAAASGTKWSGACTFSQAGTYTFYCTVHGPEMTGTVTVTTPGAPTVATGAASAVGETEATLHGTVNPQGKATTYRFKYGTSTSYGAETSEQSAGEGSADQSVSALVTGLTPGTIYHFQLVAKNASGTTSGRDQTFTTASPPGPPTATTGAATAVTETGATLKGTVNPDGKPTSYFFEWGSTSGYGQKTAEVPAGEDHADHVASAALSSLTLATVYHFRVVAKNASEEVWGADQMFTTTSPPKEPEPTPAPNPVPSPGPTSPGPSVPLVTQPTTEPGSTFGLALIAGSLKLSGRGSTVRGSIAIGPSGAGGRLEVDLLAKPSSLGGRGRRPVVVGHVVRSVVSAGKVPFSVALNARAKSALRRHHRLALAVRIVLTPAHGTAVTITKSVSMRA